MAPTTREALLDAAYDAAVGGDWARTRMADVARAAGVSRQTLYNEFGSKDALAQAMAIRAVEEFIDGTERALDEADPDNPIEAVGQAALYTLHRAADDPLIKAALVDQDGGLLPFLTTRGEPVMALARASFERYYAVHWPELSAADIARAADTIVRLTISYLIQPGDAPAEVIAARLADLARTLLWKERTHE